MIPWFLQRTVFSSFFPHNRALDRMTEFVRYLMELLEPMKGVRAKKMFGGYGIFKNEHMFGLVADDMLYLKADQKTIPSYEELGLGPFVYEKKEKKIAMSYYQAPEEALDSSEALCEWAAQAYKAAIDVKKNKTKTTARTK